MIMKVDPKGVLAWSALKRPLETDQYEWDGEILTHSKRRLFSIKWNFKVFYDEGPVK